MVSRNSHESMRNIYIYSNRTRLTSEAKTNQEHRIKTVASCKINRVALRSRTVGQYDISVFYYQCSSDIYLIIYPLFYISQLQYISTKCVNSKFNTRGLEATTCTSQSVRCPLERERGMRILQLAHKSQHTHTSISLILLICSSHTANQHQSKQSMVI